MLTKAEIETAVARCQFDDYWTFRVEHDRSGQYVSDRLYFQIIVADICNTSGKPMEWTSRKWFLSPHMTESEIIQTVFKAFTTAMEHEAREKFLVDGVSVFDPHYAIDKLVALRRQGDCLSERKEA